MQIYLVRHGKAEPGDDDAARPLMKKGRKQALAIGRAAREAGVRVGAILHSGLARAEETATILAEALEPRDGVRRADGLTPMDDPAIARATIEAADEPIALVGHLPHLGRLAAELLGAPEEAFAIATGTMLCLERGGGGLVRRSLGEGGWSLRWMLTPGLLGV
jgi:phosphohistidine phosphatase